MYIFSDDIDFIKSVLKPKKMKFYFRFLFRAETMVREKNQFNIDFFEFAFFDQDFLDSMMGNFLNPNKPYENETFFQLCLSRT